jgi:6-pyruvoyltetrahydropterin/6-carboxytetrahydropterin synthase
MMPWTITKEFHFEAAHNLPNHEGKCRSMHGHTYKVHVTLGNTALYETGPMKGMVTDFGVVKEAWKSVDAALDHRVLNEVEGLKNPTAERIAEWIFHHLDGLLDGLKSVTVWETPTSCAVYSP